MSAKDNFNKAMFDVFGVGKDQEAEAAGTAQSNDAQIKDTQPKAEPGKKTAGAAPEKAAEPAAKEAPVAVTYLAPGTAMEGKLEAKGDVEIAGSFKGDITTAGKVVVRSSIHGNIRAASLSVQNCSLTGDVNVSGLLTLDKGAKINGNVFAGEILCSGKVIGDLDVKGHSAFDECAEVEGNIITETMTMARGAKVSGALTMNAGKGKKG